MKCDSHQVDSSVLTSVSVKSENEQMFLAFYV